MPVLRREALRALRELLAEAFAASHAVGEERQRLSRAERRFDAELLLLEHAHFIELHHRTDRGAERNRIPAVLVGPEVRVRERFEVVDAVRRAERPGCLVLEPSG